MGFFSLLSFRIPLQAVSLGCSMFSCDCSSIIVRRIYIGVTSAVIT